jgi:hypothetical protein
VRKSRSPLRGGGQDNRSHGDDQSYDLGDEEDPIGPVAAEMKGHGALLRRSGFQVSTAGRLLSRSYPPSFAGRRSAALIHSDVRLFFARAPNHSCRSLTHQSSWPPGDHVAHLGDLGVLDLSGTTDEEIRPILEVGGMQAGKISGWFSPRSGSTRATRVRAQEHPEADLHFLNLVRGVAIMGDDFGLLARSSG